MSQTAASYPPARIRRSFPVVRGLAIVAGVLVLGLVLSQVFLPRLAVKRLRSDLEAHGPVRLVSVTAFPALKLLLGHADSVTVRMTRYRAGPGPSGPHDLGDLLAKTKHLGKLDVEIGSAHVLPLALHAVGLTKHGATLAARASVTQDELTAALPRGFDVRPAVSGDGQLLFRGSVRLFGIGARAGAKALARDGELVVEPVGLPVGGLAALTVFSDPRVAITAVGARESDDGFTVTARARVR